MIEDRLFNTDQFTKDHDKDVSDDPIEDLQTTLSEAYIASDHDSSSDGEKLPDPVIAYTYENYRDAKGITRNFPEKEWGVETARAVIEEFIENYNSFREQDWLQASKSLQKLEYLQKMLDYCKQYFPELSPKELEETNNILKISLADLIRSKMKEK